MSLHKTKRPSISIETRRYLRNLHLKKSSVSATGTQPLTQFYDEFYVGNVSIGTPPQTLSLSFDTSTSQFWVDGSGCTTDGCSNQGPGLPTKSIYDKTKSSTYSALTGSYSNQLSYGDLGVDVVNLGGLVAPEVLGISSFVFDIFMYYPIDGVLGLGFNADGTTAISELLPLMNQPVFTAWFDIKYTSQSSPGGEILFGGIDTVHCASTVNYVPINTSAYPYWQFTLNKYSIGTYFVTNSYQVIVNTGTDGLGFPPDIYNATLKQIIALFSDDFGDDPYVLCSKIPTLPDVVVTIGNINYRIPANQYVVDLEDGSINCYLAITNTYNKSLFYFGDAWMRSYCNVFDIGRKQIGFSQIIQTS